ncbi:MAG: CHAT domain-containing protein [Actinomycetota bacterium]|nr:CHAT domain-containing protein [Actinomycetota bacterium]
MATTSFARGRLRVTHPVTYRATSVRTRSRGIDGTTPQDVDTVVVNTLRDNGFNQVQRVAVTSGTARGLGDRGLRARPRPAAVTIALDVADDEDAVVLLETGGCYSWVLPTHEPRPRSRGTDRALSGRVARFDISIAPTSGAAERTRVRDLGWPTSSAGARATVLSFAAGALGDAAIRLLESRVEPGFVHVTSADPSGWTRVDDLAAVSLDAARPNRVLLLVHGTFDSTLGAFSGLAATAEGRAFLEAAVEAYDAVVGFDHRTLSVDPLANATDLGQRLAALVATAPVTLDVLCHSRGGLTARSFAESVLPGLAWRGRVDRAVFVAATNAGTHFADADRWKDLADLYTNLVSAHARALAAVPGGGVLADAAVSAVRGIGALVSWLASYATASGSVPGLAAMNPDGAFVETINQDQPGQPRPGTPWFVVSSDFHATTATRPEEIPAEVFSRLVEGVVDKVFDGPNDLVVDDASMSAIDLPHGGGYVRDTLALGTNAVVYHTNYFSQPVVAKALQSWLVDRLDSLDSLDSLDTASAGPPPNRVEPPLVPPEQPHQRGPVAVEERLPDGWQPSFPTNAEPPDESATPTVRARLRAEMPLHPTVGLSVSVRVRLSRGALDAATGTASRQTVLTIRPEIPVSIQLVPSTNAVLEDEDLRLVLLQPGSASSDVTFAVHAVAVGPVRVRVLARQGAELLGTLELATEAVSAAVAAVASDAPGGQAVTRGQVEIASSTSPVLADIPWLEISQIQRGGQTHFQYELRMPGADLSSTDHRLTYESADIGDPEAFVSNRIKEVMALWFDYSTAPRTYLAKLQDLGAALFEQLFPQEMQRFLWTNRGRLEGLFLLTDEPFIPWELVHLKPATGPRQKAPRFLGQLGLVRWQFTPFPSTATLRARPGEVFAVCPDYADDRNDLDQAGLERAFLTATLGATEVTATEAKVRALLRRRGSFDLLHFSGHGEADATNIADARILLAGRRVGDALVADYLSSTTVAENARLSRRDGPGPLVVLNACQVGRSGEELTSLGGFARAFLEAGASAFVSCLWSVNQVPAQTFAETFYRQLLDGRTVAEAALAARSAARNGDRGDATWLAYVIYARPDAVLVRD